jgi:hypothetical protein
MAIVYCWGLPFPPADRMEELLDAFWLLFLWRFVDPGLLCLQPRQWHVLRNNPSIASTPTSPPFGVTVSLRSGSLSRMGIA